MITILEADFLLSAQEEKGWPAPAAPEVAFCGRSNVGKSSCLNTLAGRKQLARVSNTPGRTRLINFFEITLTEKTRSGARGAAQHIRLVDLPGYGFAKGPLAERMTWKKMIELYLERRAPLCALIILVDGELGPQESDQEMLGWARTLGRQTLAVATKLDRLPRTRRAAQLTQIARTLEMPVEQVLGFSATERLGVDELWKALLAVTKVAPRAPPAPE